MSKTHFFQMTPRIYYCTDRKLFRQAFEQSKVCIVESEIFNDKQVMGLFRNCGPPCIFAFFSQTCAVNQVVQVQESTSWVKFYSCVIFSWFVLLQGDQKENKSEQALQIIGHVVEEFYANKR
jgi:hypothetical protein